MFARRYFPTAYFADRYWTKAVGPVTGHLLARAMTLDAEVAQSFVVPGSRADSLDLDSERAEGVTLNA